MNQFDQFQNALLLEPISKNKYRVSLDPRYFVGKTPHGGYLNALMHKALILSVPHSVAISSSMQYLNRIEDKDVVLEVEIFKTSTGSSSGLVKLCQDNKICTVFNAICSDFEHMKGFDGILTNPPDLYKNIKSEIARRILSKNKEKWQTVNMAYNEIDYLRDQADKRDDKIELKKLDEINDFIMSIEKKYEIA